MYIIFINTDINKLISVLNKHQLEILLIINFFAFYLTHTFFSDIVMVDGGYGIVNFINLYMIGAYIRKYKDNYNNKKVLISAFLICTGFTTIFSFFTGRAYAYTTIFNLISSLSIFMIFKNINIKNNAIVNKLAGYTFAVYIIHEHPLICQTIIFEDIFKRFLFKNSYYMVFHLVFTVLCIYIICVLIEKVRHFIFKKIFDKQIDAIAYEIKCE